mmetsp:Transcript_16921/g.48303  ORF Transcript_16921/g.48303 Transcript_16921/m.48303 type:complete len:110 (+) Transcript_16921:643-972(+)
MSRRNALAASRCNRRSRGPLHVVRQSDSHFRLRRHPNFDFLISSPFKWLCMAPHYLDNLIHTLMQGAVQPANPPSHGFVKLFNTFLKRKVCLCCTLVKRSIELSRITLN